MSTTTHEVETKTEPPARRWFKSFVPLLVVIAVYCVVRSFYWNCQPIGDGACYYQGLLNANEAPFDLLNYTVDGHICQGFFLLMSLPYRLIHQDYYLFNIWLTLFGTLSIIAFYQLLAFFSVGRARSIELALFSALLAFHPTVLSNMIHFNLDSAVLTFFLWYWFLLLKDRTIAASFLGILLILSKETAVLLVPFRKLPSEGGSIRG
jgi:hypothetical protein